MYDFCSTLNKNRIQANYNILVICSNQVYPGFTWFEQFINFVSSNWFAAKSVEQMTVEQSHFEQFTPTLFFCKNEKQILQVWKSFWNPASDVTQVKMLHEREIFVICINITFLVTFLSILHFITFVQMNKKMLKVFSNLKALKQNLQYILHYYSNQISTMNVW